MIADVHSIYEGEGGVRLSAAARDVESPVLPVRVRSTLLERMQETQGMPYHPPTLQFAVAKRGHYMEYSPVNPLAKQLCKAFFRAWINDDGKKELEAAGFAVEVRP